MPSIFDNIPTAFPGAQAPLFSPQQTPGFGFRNRNLGNPNPLGRLAASPVSGRFGTTSSVGPLPSTLEFLGPFGLPRQIQIPSRASPVIPQATQRVPGRGRGAPPTRARRTPTRARPSPQRQAVERQATQNALAPFLNFRRRFFGDPIAFRQGVASGNIDVPNFDFRSSARIPTSALGGNQQAADFFNSPINRMRLQFLTGGL